MPNKDNILEPISLISAGRSGTSLTTNILRAHPDVDAAGETIDLLYWTYTTIAELEIKVRAKRYADGTHSRTGRAAAATRSVFLSMMPAPNKSAWMQKPIGVPKYLQYTMALEDTPLSDHLDEYWDVMHDVFPKARNITILRHPYDVMLSAMAYFDRDQKEAWVRIIEMAEIVMHPKSNIDFAISYAGLVEQPEVEVPRMLRALNLREDPACMDALQKVYVPKPKRLLTDGYTGEDRREAGFTYRDRWNEIDTSFMNRAQTTLLCDMWARFGQTLTL